MGLTSKQLAALANDPSKANELSAMNKGDLQAAAVAGSDEDRRNAAKALGHAAPFAYPTRDEVGDVIDRALNPPRHSGLEHVTLGGDAR